MRLILTRNVEIFRARKFQGETDKFAAALNGGPVVKVVHDGVTE